MTFSNFILYSRAIPSYKTKDDSKKSTGMKKEGMNLSELVQALKGMQQ